MRHAINISLPPKIARAVKDEVKAGNYASTSEFFRDILREREDRRLLAELKQSQKEIAGRKGKVLRSLGDLD